MTTKKLSMATQVFTLILAFTLIASTSADARAAERELIPMGCTIGIQMQTAGVIVVGLSDVITQDGAISPAGEAGLLPGDIVKKLGGTDIGSAAAFIAETEKLKDADISITIDRMGIIMQFTARPRLSVDGSYKLGLWLRDSVSGIGTVTFLDPQSGLYGALGHAISDIDTGVLLPLSEGSILDSEIIDVRPGSADSPGERCGRFDPQITLGTIEKNTPQGIFGIMETNAAEGRAISIARDDEIKTGGATILANVRGREVREFDIAITRVCQGAESTRNLMLTITDPDLIAITGGIVQGMSGSPIIQNGKLVGAVTHVLINDPRSGYGISIGNMLRTADSDTAFGYAT